MGLDWIIEEICNVILPYAVAESTPLTTLIIAHFPMINPQTNGTELGKKYVK
jgi:hypothetical protein